MQCHTQNLGDACLSGSTASSAREAGRSFGYKWTTGPMTTVRDGQGFRKAIAVTRVSSAAWLWFSECSRRDTLVHGNHPYSIIQLNSRCGVNVIFFVGACRKESSKLELGNKAVE
jgi:hypothetical protein